MGMGEGPKADRKTSRWLVPAIGYSISLASLWWAFAHFPVLELGDHLRTMDWWWLAFAVALELGSFFLDGWRWRELLRPVSAPPYKSAVHSVFVGTFVNDILPARAGEAVRCFLLSYEADLHVPLVITSLVILRVMDGICVVIFYFATSFVVEGAGTANDVMYAYAAVVAALAVGLLYILFHKQSAHTFLSRSGWGSKFAHFLDEVHNLGNWREIRIVMGLSAAYWAIQICAVWAITRADNFYFSFGQMAFLLIVKSVGTLVPTAPAGVGAFQATAIYALRRFFTEAPDAKILAELLFGFLTLPGLIGGAIAVALAGYNLKELVRHAQESHRKHRTKES